MSMTLEQAIRILHPETRLTALVTGFNSHREKLNEASILACEVMQREVEMGKIWHNTPETLPPQDGLYYGKKDETKSMYPNQKMDIKCWAYWDAFDRVRYTNGQWTLNMYQDETSATALAKLVWAEGRGIESDTEKAGICWAAINRVEAGYGTLWQVITAPNQFAYYSSSPVDPALYELAKDVLIRWDMERCGHENVGRVLPRGYLWFHGDGNRNYFRDAYKNGNVWNWGLESHYES